MFGWFRSWESLLERAKAEIAAKDRELARRVAARVCRRNLSIRRGRFLTAEDLERRRREAAKLRFR